MRQAINSIVCGLFISLCCCCKSQRSSEEEISYFDYSPAVNKVDSTSNPDYLISVGLRSDQYFDLKAGRDTPSSDHHTQYFLVTIIKKQLVAKSSGGAVISDTRMLKSMLEESFSLSLSTKNAKPLSVENIKANEDLSHLNCLVLFNKESGQGDLKFMISETLLGSPSEISFEDVDL